MEQIDFHAAALFLRGLGCGSEILLENQDGTEEQTAFAVKTVKCPDFLWTSHPNQGISNRNRQKN
ncbi:hypothetical protein P0G10_04945 [Eubacteriales bacterium DFI.9.88]|nr:hypothetical protein [Eubacteriales bacterium DFI.9.88]